MPPSQGAVLLQCEGPGSAGCNNRVLCHEAGTIKAPSFHRCTGWIFPATVL